MSEAAEVDLVWLAFRYVSQEMSCDEAALFEDRLMVDQAAREAVAQAVQLTQAIALAAACPVPAAVVSPQAPRKQRQSWTRWVRPAAWISVGIAAGMLLSVGLSPRPAGNSLSRNGSSKVGRHVLSSGILSSVWASFEEEDRQAEDGQFEDWDAEFSQAGGPFPEFAEDGTIRLAKSGNPDVGTDDSDVEDNDEEGSIPAWLLAAVFVRADAKLPVVNDPPVEN